MKEEGGQSQVQGEVKARYKREITARYRREVTTRYRRAVIARYREEGGHSLLHVSPKYVTQMGRIGMRKEVGRYVLFEITFRYNFDCMCEACAENWPTENKMVITQGVLKIYFYFIPTIF